MGQLLPLPAWAVHGRGCRSPSNAPSHRPRAGARGWLLRAPSSCPSSSLTGFCLASVKWGVLKMQPVVEPHRGVCHQQTLQVPALPKALGALAPPGAVLQLLRGCSGSAAKSALTPVPSSVTELDLFDLFVPFRAGGIIVRLWSRTSELDFNYHSRSFPMGDILRQCQSGLGWKDHEAHPCCLRPTQMLSPQLCQDEPAALLWAGAGTSPILAFSHSPEEH